MQWKTGAPTQDVPIPRGEARTGSGPMDKRWQTARKGGAQKEGGFRRLSSDEFGWSRTDDSIKPHDLIATRWAERWFACVDSRRFMVTALKANSSLELKRYCM